MLDYVLISRRFASSLQDTKVLPASCIGSDHDLVVAKLRMKLKTRKEKDRTLRLDWDNVAACPVLKEQYATELGRQFQEMSEHSNIDDLYQEFKSVVYSAAAKTCPKKRHKTKPWITDQTLDLVENRKRAKANGSKQLCNFLSREIKRRLRADREKYCGCDNCACLQEKEPAGLLKLQGYQSGFCG